MKSIHGPRPGRPQATKGIDIRSRSLFAMTPRIALRPTLIDALPFHFFEALAVKTKPMWCPCGHDSHFTLPFALHGSTSKLDLLLAAHQCTHCTGCRRAIWHFSRDNLLLHHCLTQAVESVGLGWQVEQKRHTLFLLIILYSHRK